MDLNSGTSDRAHFKNWSTFRGSGFLTERKERCDGSRTELLSVSHIYGVIPRRNIVAGNKQISRAVSLEGYKRVYVNDIVINTMLAWYGGVGHSALDGAASPSYSVYAVGNSAAPRFIHYLFRSEQTKKLFKSWSTGIQDSRLRLYPDALRRISFLLPELFEQELIVRYLDHAELRIAKAIQAKQKMISLLNEQKQVIISDQVTRGLNLNTPLKDSGQEWLGQVPAHWELHRMKSQFTEIVKKGRPELPLLAATQAMGVVTKESYGLRTVTATRGLENLKVVEPGDFVISLRSFQGGLEISHASGIISPAYTILRAKTSVNNAFYSYLFKSKPFLAAIQMTVTGIREGQNVDYRRLGLTMIPIPPVEEQQEITNAIAGKTESIDKAVIALQKEIDLLREYRTVLISNVVTGKKDVRVEAEGLPNVDPEELTQLLLGEVNVDPEEDEDNGASELE
jgi:type I restriction enzyme S subunit